MDFATEKEAYDLLERLEIPYLRVDHPAITSVKNVPFELPGPQVKNLVLKTKKGRAFYLIILPDEKMADIKDLAKRLGENRLSFASEENLYDLLKVVPGTVTPLALPNDTEHKLQIVVDSSINHEDTAGFHPNVNTTTLMIQFHDFEKILFDLGYEYLSLKL
ncbi:MAG: prolyl-tRNA synthetase associated domain-containing protein [Lactobacillales bacterium]|nr:prolyl-tRNA synthetase associated domain-containing protein [Lactobacillales bacterium]